MTGYAVLMYENHVLQERLIFGLGKEEACGMNKDQEWMIYAW